jgi:hypothetical protein
MLKVHFSENYLDIITKPFYKIDTSLDEEKFKSVLEEIQKNRHLKKHHILVFEDNSIGKKYLIGQNEKFFGIDKTVCSHDKNDSITINFSTKSLIFKNLFTEDLERKEALLLFYIVSHKKHEVEKLIIDNFNLYEYFKKDIDYAVEIIEKAPKDKNFNTKKAFLDIKKSLIMNNNGISFETICKFFLNQGKTFFESFDHKAEVLKIYLNNNPRDTYFHVFLNDNKFYVGLLWESEKSIEQNLPVAYKERVFSFSGFNGQYNLKQTIFDKHVISKEDYNFINQYLKEFDLKTENDASLLLMNLEFDLNRIGEHIDINVDSKELLENLIYFK